MQKLLAHQQKFLKSFVDGPQNFRESDGGHMSYNRMLFDNAVGDPYFVKAHDSSLFDGEWREKEMRGFLLKEGRVYEHLRAEKFEYIPENSTCSEDTLILSGLIKAEGWQWRAPNDLQKFDAYVTDVLQVLSALEKIPPPTRSDYDEVAIDVFYNHGWDKLHDVDTPELIRRNVEKWKDKLLPETVEYAHRMTDAIGAISVKRANVAPSVLNHHDARQANIAWHPVRGVRIVDWSWADDGLLKGDSTMFLLDLHKAGYDISSYSDCINPIYAKMVLGYWLQRSGTPHMEGNDIVRMQQFLSAIKASELLLT